jgi:hypothetical protein
MKKLIFHLFYSFLLLGFAIQIAEAQVLEDYTNKWEEGGNKTWLSDNDRLKVKLDLNSFPMAYMSFEIPEQSVVFVGEKLWFFSERDTVFSEKVQDLQYFFNLEKADLIVFKRGIKLGESKVQKGLKPILYKPSSLIQTDLNKKRDFQRQEIRDFFIIGLVTILFGIALYKMAYPYLFEVMVRPLSLINAEDFSDSGSLQKFFSFDVLSYVALVNMLTSLGGVLGLIFFKYEWLNARFSIEFKTMFFLWLLVAGIMTVLTILKFAGIRMVAYLFDLQKLEFPHFFYLLRLVAFASAFLVLVSTHFLMNEFSSVKGALSLSFTTFFWVYIAGLAGLFLKMMSRLSFKKYHLFAYLCIAELVPFLILSKWIMVLGE